MDNDTHIDLETTADSLLRAAGKLGRNGGIYTETQLTRKIRNEQKRMPRLDEYAPPEELMAYLVDRQVEELIDVSRLTTRQEIVYRLRVCGLSTRQIAATLRCRYRAVAATLRAARRKVRQACRDGRYAGWYEVYLSEVNRPAYRRKS